jgi:Uma2 family endonuclease
MNILHPLTTTARLGSSSAGLTMTLDELEAIKDFEEGNRHERINGVVVATPEPSPSPWNSNDELGRLLRNYGQDHPQGHCLSGTLPDVYLITSPTLQRFNHHQ